MPEHGFAALGQDLTTALLTGDVALYRSLMSLPLRIVPRGGAPYVLTDPDALGRDFQLYHLALTAAGVTDIFRQVDTVSPTADGFRVHFTVHLMARAHRIADPFRSEMLVVAVPGGLRIAEIVSTAEHIDWTLGRRPHMPGAGLI